jgi:penicillin-binding protein 1A
MRAGPGAERTILEAFKPGTAPPDSYAVIGVTDPDGRPIAVSPDADRAVMRGPGGLY